jgi:hypothetical protein
MVKISEKTTPNDGASSSSQPKPRLGGGGAKFLSFEEKRNKPYSFRKDKVMKIFQDAMKNGLKLPESKRPEEIGRSD